MLILHASSPTARIGRDSRSNPHVVDRLRRSGQLGISYILLHSPISSYIGFVGIGYPLSLLGTEPTK